MKCTYRISFPGHSATAGSLLELVGSTWGAQGKKLCSLGVARCMFGIAAWTSREGIIKVEVPVSVSGLNVINMILTYCT